MAKCVKQCICHLQLGRETDTNAEFITQGGAEITNDGVCDRRFASPTVAH